MTLVRVAAVPLNQTPLDWDGNLQNILAGLADARARGASVVCMPELCISGYGCEDAFFWPETTSTALQVLGELAPHTKGIVLSVGLPFAFEGAIYNCAALLVDGQIVGLAAKRHLAGEGVHYEPRWFRPWPRGVHRTLSIGGRPVLLGDVVFDVGGVRLGFEICEDAWVVERPGFDLAQAGVSLVLNPSASHFAFGKHAVRRKLVLGGAREFGVAYVYCNLLGNEAGRVVYDGDALIACQATGADRTAEIVAETRRFSFRPWTIALATLDLAAFAPGARAASGRPVCVRGFAFPEHPVLEPTTEQSTGADGGGELSREVALARVLALGLFDYMRKTRSQGFVVSLSGGADSAAVSLAVWLMVHVGVAELGETIFRERAGLRPASPPAGSRSLVGELLLTLYQATENSSEATRLAAQQLAEAVGAEHHVLDVQPLVAAYTGLVRAVEGREFTWMADDIALQNIQARVRAPSAWMLANLRGRLLLCTSNRSEAAVGYATMDGDTAGGLCPVGGVDKAFLRKWLEFLSRGGLPETGPLPQVQSVLEQHPTAELRPFARAQTDETDLMPYDVLAAIERGVVIERRSIPEVLGLLEQVFPQHQLHDLRSWLGRFLRLFSQNQWKRERFAPSFHVDDANLDPKTWCRFPILSGGFTRELSALLESKGE